MDNSGYLSPVIELIPILVGNLTTPNYISRKFMFISNIKPSLSGTFIEMIIFAKIIKNDDVFLTLSMPTL